MGNVAWVACHSEAPLDRGRLGRWSTAVETTLPQVFAGRTRSDAVRDHVSLTAWVDVDAGPATWPQVESSDGALGVSDGFPIGFDRIGLDAPSPLGIAAAFRRDFGQMDRFHPPYANIAADDGGLSIALDPLGLAKVYRAQSRGLTVWSNRASVASLFAFGLIEASEDGWVTYLCNDRFFDDLTAVKRVRLESPRTLVRAENRSDGLDVTRLDAITPLFGADGAADDVAGAVDDALDEFYGSLAALGVGQVRMPLSGGRDSRMLAASGLRRERINEFFTSVPPELDVEIARQLVDRVDRKIPWKQQDKSADVRRRDEEARTSGLTTDEIWSRLTQYQAYADGDGNTTPQTRGVVTEVRFDPVLLWGIGGEFGRAFYYNEAAVQAPEARMHQFWGGMRRGDALVDEAARRRVLPRRADALRARLEAHGVHGLKQLDYFYIFQRARRLKSRVGTVSGIRPFYSPAYVRPTNSQTPIQRVRTTFYRDVVRRNYPAWADVPFSHELKAENPRTSTAQSHAAAFWDSPYATALGEEMMALVRDQGLVQAERAGTILTRPAEIDLRAVSRMRMFDRLLNYFSYQAYVERANRDFRAAGGEAVGAPARRIPGITAREPDEAPIDLVRSAATRIRRLGRRIGGR